VRAVVAPRQQEDAEQAGLEPLPECVSVHDPLTFPEAAPGELLYAPNLPGRKIGQVRAALEDFARCRGRARLAGPRACGAFAGRGDWEDRGGRSPSSSEAVGRKTIFG